MGPANSTHMHATPEGDKMLDRELKSYSQDLRRSDFLLFDGRRLQIFGCIASRGKGTLRVGELFAALDLLTALSFASFFPISDGIDGIVPLAAATHAILSNRSAAA